jgi:site-specific DNA recombinase
VEGSKEAMKTAAIYCRVSTEDQEREGTSLQTQLENCLNYCRDRGYETAHRFSEAYSGLTLERPKLNELRELVRAGDIDVIVVYCLDRLSRDPTHGVILTQELEKHHVTLEAVIETIDSSELGKLISYIRGFASKLEAEKIRERTMRGRKAKAEQGQIPSGGFAKLFGYNYIKVAVKGGGRRIVNEAEGRWLPQIFKWLVEDRLSTKAIARKLQAMHVPTKTGRPWTRQTVLGIIKNPAYIGKTYAFRKGKSGRKPVTEWIEIPGVTPPLIDEELFEAAQKQLEENRKNSPRNTRRQYLLSGHLFCRKCGRRYYAYFKSERRNGKRLEYRRYRCSASLRTVEPIHRCHNKGWAATRLEQLIWEQVEHVIDNPELIVSEIEKQQQETNKIGVLEAELHRLERQLKGLDREQEQLLQWALKGFPEETVVSENKRINQKRSTLQAQKAELETQVKASQEAVISQPKLERFVELVQEKLSALDFETKRMVLDMLGIKVWLDGYNMEITGTIPILEGDIVTTQS